MKAGNTTRQIVYHILFWIITMTFFAVSEWGYRDSFLDAIIFELLFLPSRLIAVYVNWFWLMPKYLYRNRLFEYFGSLFVLLLLCGLAQRYMVLVWGYPTFFPKWTMGSSIQVWNVPRLVQTMLIIVSPVAYTTGFRLFRNWYEERRALEALQQEKTSAELNFLKAQTNPHFLFNTLNSIYGLALEQSPKTPALILKLSDILSYTLYESNARQIALEKEIALIENIIQLEKERYGKRVKLFFQVVGNTADWQIAPLILVPFVENAFKHGLKDEIDTGQIDIRLSTQANKLNFEIRNSIANPQATKLRGGLGLQNVQRRLQLLYGDQHELEVEHQNQHYQVVLTINAPGHVV